MLADKNVRPTIMEVGGTPKLALGVHMRGTAVPCPRAQHAAPVHEIDGRGQAPPLRETRDSVKDMTMRIVGRADTRGFTLVEVLIAMVILGIGILGVTVLFPRALRDTQVASGTTVSSTYADTVVDQLRAQGYSGLRQEAESKNLDWLRIGRNVGLDRLTRTNLLYRGTDVRLRDATVLRNAEYTLQLYQVVVTVPLTVGPKEQFITFIARQ